jgi:hypothetical protein
MWGLMSVRGGIVTSSSEQRPAALLGANAVAEHDVVELDRARLVGADDLRVHGYLHRCVRDGTSTTVAAPVKGEIHKRGERPHVSDHVVEEVQDGVAHPIAIARGGSWSSDVARTHRRQSGQRR